MFTPRQSWCVYRKFKLKNKIKEMRLIESNILPTKTSVLRCLPFGIFKYVIDPV